MGAIKQKLDIEKLVRWAYVEELPKQFEGGNSLMADLAMLGAPVDSGRSGDKMPIGAGPPHPDALLIDYYVRGLPSVRVDLKARGNYLMGHLAPYLDRDDPIVSAMMTGPVVSVNFKHAGRRRARATVTRDAMVMPQAESAAALIILHARLGNRPIWDLGQPSLTRCKPVMVGRQINRNRFTEGSMCPLKLEPPAQEIASARFEYMVWHQALVALVTVLRGMDDHVALYPAAAAAPWLTGPEHQEKPTRVFDDGARHVGSKLPLKPSRERVLPPVPAGQHGPVIHVDGKQLTTWRDGG